MTDVQLDEEDNVKYHDSSPITYNTKQHCCLALIPRLGSEELRKGSTYRAALVELIGEIMFSGLSCLIVSGIVRTGVAYPVVYISIVHVFLFMFMISSTVPGSGGHLNPVISLACMFAKVMTVSRCVVYIIAQVIGATIAGMIVRLMVGEEVAQTTGIGTCGIGNYDPSKAFLVEFVFNFVLLFVCYGMVFDPHQGEVAGPIFGPFSVSLIFCFNFVVSGLIAPELGYGGAAMNPARCLGPAIAMGNLDYMYIFWVAPFLAALAHGVLYILVPPYHESLYSKLDTKRKKE
jgi:glycerol uptake facilitator-like aquaporin